MLVVIKKLLIALPGQQKTVSLHLIVGGQGSNAGKMTLMI
jgi:hypothetical protein